mmetsp:Transcript_32122/g.50121  ORF Transcript_32122/g.50121 Transcript_32122/m.50121 type:complete len:141 (-) Transcript_32122:765-1187(-)
MRKCYAKDEGLKNIYFRPVSLKREAVVPRQRLSTYFLHKGESDRQWSQIGVDCDQLTDIRPEIINERHLKYEEIQTQLNLAPDMLRWERTIRQRSCPFSDPGGLETPSSAARGRIAKVRREDEPCFYESKVGIRFGKTHR